MDIPDIIEEEIPQYHEEKETTDNGYIALIINNSKAGNPVVIKCNKPPEFENGMYIFHKTNGKEVRIFPGTCTIIVTNDNLDTLN